MVSLEEKKTETSPKIIIKNLSRKHDQSVLLLTFKWFLGSYHCIEIYVMTRMETIQQCNL